MQYDKIQRLKKQFPIGAIVQLDSMGADERNPITSGIKGIVLAVDDIGTVHCKFDNGRIFGLCSDVDRFHRI